MVRWCVVFITSYCSCRRSQIVVYQLTRFLQLWSVYIVEQKPIKLKMLTQKFLQHQQLGISLKPLCSHWKTCFLASHVEACKPWLWVKKVQRQHKSLGTEKLRHPFQTICMWEAETFHLYTNTLHQLLSHQRLIMFLSLWKTANKWDREGLLPARDIPNFAAVLGKSPRSTVPKDKRLFEYLKKWKMRWACIFRQTVKLGFFLYAKLTWWTAQESNG